MSQRHPIQSGLPMFITTNCRNRIPIFADPAAARIAIEILYEKQFLRPFYIYGFVIMPDHCHFLLKVPKEGSISTLMHVYKRGVSFAIGRGPIWQPRFYMKLIENIHPVLRYIHDNPVKADLCHSSIDYPWSSASGRWDISRVNCMDDAY